jgi:hypothetical protein
MSPDRVNQVEIRWKSGGNQVQTDLSPEDEPRWAGAESLSPNRLGSTAGPVLWSVLGPMNQLVKHWSNTGQTLVMKTGSTRPGPLECVGQKGLGVWGSVQQWFGVQGKSGGRAIYIDRAQSAIERDSRTVFRAPSDLHLIYT